MYKAIITKDSYIFSYQFVTLKLPIDFKISISKFAEYYG